MEREKVLLVSIVFVGTLCTAAHAGPLEPPPGPVTATGTTIGEVEPRMALSALNTPGDANSVFRITQPGSYYLTGNVTGVAGKSGIEIASSCVTLDLGGFRVQGVPGVLAGVTTDGAIDCSGTEVSNGKVSGWTDGISLRGLTRNITVRGVRATGNLGTGIDVGTGSRVDACHASDNLRGIVAGLSCAIADCVVRGNGGNGINIRSGSVRGCVAESNAFIGIRAGDADEFSPGRACVVAQCSSSANGTVGIHLLISGSEAVDCSTMNNTGAGVQLSSGCLASRCASSGNASGIAGSSHATIMDCVARSNLGAGIDTSSHAMISRCTASQNAGIGIDVEDGSTVAECRSNLNVGDGILATRSCEIRNNRCHGNGAGAGTGAGIRVTDLLNRIEGNHCSEGDFGFRINGTRNLLVRNTAASNVTNWHVDAGNNLLVISAPVAGSMFGDSGGTSVGADPNANYTH